MELEKIIETFDYQIKRDIKNGLKKEDSLSYWNKLLFLKTKDYTIREWKEIRDEDYYKQKTKWNGVDSVIYTLTKIKQHENKKR